MNKKRVRFVGKELPNDIEKDGLYDLLIAEDAGKKIAIVCKRGRLGDPITRVEYKPEEWNAVAEVKLQLSITDEDIDDIMAVALEGGINYWCDEAEVEGDYLGTYANEQISRGGRLLLHDMEEDEYRILTRESFIDGVVEYLQNPHPYDILDGDDGRFVKIDTCQCDAVVCDMIIQYAIFGEVTYG